MGLSTYRPSGPWENLWSHSPTSRLGLFPAGPPALEDAGGGGTVSGGSDEVNRIGDRDASGVSRQTGGAGPADLKIRWARISVPQPYGWGYFLPGLRP